jgi:hypothetical protein
MKPQQPFIRSILAILAGFAAAAASMAITTTLAAKLFLPPVAAGESLTLPVEYFIMTIASGLVCATLGGLVMGRIVRYSIMLHAGALALLVVFMGFLYGLIVAASDAPEAAAQPTWYGFVIALMGGAGALAGGWLSRPQAHQTSSSP